MPGTPKDPTPWASDRAGGLASGWGGLSPASSYPPWDLRQKLLQRQQRRRQASSGPRPPSQRRGPRAGGPTAEKEAELTTHSCLYSRRSNCSLEVLLHTARIPVGLQNEQPKIKTGQVCKDVEKRTRVQCWWNVRRCSCGGKTARRFPGKVQQLLEDPGIPLLGTHTEELRAGFPRRPWAAPTSTPALFTAAKRLEETGVQSQT